MTDISNKFPSWGESGTLPADGFFYQGGEQVNEKHLDALWHNVQAQTSQLITGIRDRVRDVEGDVILDGGLVTSTTANTREVSVSASTDGAYVDGQKTGSTTSTTITFTANGGTTTRTDSVWVDTTGTVGKTEGTTSVASDRAKIAEVDISSSDTISAVRNMGRDRARVFASETAPDSFFSGDVWYDRNNSTTKIYSNGAAREVFFADGSNPLTGNVDLNGNSLTDGDGTVNLATSLELGGDVTDGTTTVWDGTNGYIPESSVQQGSGSGLDADTLDGKHASSLKDPVGWEYITSVTDTDSSTSLSIDTGAITNYEEVKLVGTFQNNRTDMNVDYGAQMWINNHTVSDYDSYHTTDTNSIDGNNLSYWHKIGNTTYDGHTGSFELVLSTPVDTTVTSPTIALRATSGGDSKEQIIGGELNDTTISSVNSIQFGSAYEAVLKADIFGRNRLQ